MEVDVNTIQARFISDSGEEAGPPLDLPIDVDVKQLELICNALLKNVSNNFYVFVTFQLQSPFFRMNKHLIYSSSTMTKLKAT
jgi:NLE (NUC135) domain